MIFMEIKEVADGDKNEAVLAEVAERLKDGAMIAACE